MDMWLNAAALVFAPLNFLIIVAGCVFGIVIGAIPGLTSTMGVALMVPVTFAMEPSTGLMLLGSVYCSSVYGGSISAILLNTPGTPAGAATVLDGHQMTLKGQSKQALGISAISSCIGGVFSAIVLATMAPWLAKQALRFGPPEYFALAVFGLTIISSLAGKNPYKGLLAGVLGLLLATVGMDPVHGIDRFSFGSTELMDGFNLIPVLIGLFSVSQAFVLMTSGKVTMDAVFAAVKGRFIPPMSEMIRLAPNFLRSSIIGTVIGIIPGVGSDPAAFIAYNEAMRWSKHPEKFGTGILDGVVAPETSNNAVTGGSLVPLLTLGIPGNAVSAVFLGGLLIHGLRPGPMLFEQNGDILYALFFSLFITNILFMLIGIAGTRVFMKVLKIPPVILGVMIMVLSIIGSYAIHNNLFDVWVMFAFGFMGYIFRLYGIPLAPVVLAIILGPMAEQSFRQGMLMSQGDPMIFFSRPISLTFLLIAAGSFVAPFLRKNKHQASHG